MPQLVEFRTDMFLQRGWCLGVMASLGTSSSCSGGTAAVTACTGKLAGWFVSPNL